VKVLVITGSMGAGKTTVLGEASDLLAVSQVAYAVIDLDGVLRTSWRFPLGRCLLRHGSRQCLKELVWVESVCRLSTPLDAASGVYQRTEDSGPLTLPEPRNSMRFLISSDDRSRFIRRIRRICSPTG